MAVDDEGAPFLAGQMKGTTDFAPGPVVTSQGGWDGLVVRVVP